MTSLRHVVPHIASAGVAVVLACTMAGCNGSAGMSMTSASSQGATIQGTVVGAGVSSAPVGATSAASKIRVSVVGTGLSTVTDSSGRFVLTGLAGGSVSLRFEGPGVHATLEIGGLAEGQVLTITVTLSGSRATLVSPGSDGDDDDDEAEVEFKGSIESITPPSLRVAGRTVLTDGNTRIERDDHRVGLTDLRFGETAKVEGVALADGSVLAREIEVGQGGGGDDDDGDHDDDAED